MFTQLLNEEKNLIPSIVILLENTNLVIRGKTILTILLILKIETKWIEILSETKFFIALEKLMKDNYKYVQYCLHHIIIVFDELVPFILKQIETEFLKSNAISSDSQDNSYFDNQKKIDLSPMNTGSKINYKGLNGNLNYLNTIFQICNTQLLKMRYINVNFIDTVFKFWEYYCNSNKTQIKVYLY